LIGKFGRYIESLEMRCMDPGHEVFHVIDETPKVEVGKSRENNEAEIERENGIEERGVCTDQFWVGFSMGWKAVDIKVLELGCCGQSSGEDLW